MLLKQARMLQETWAIVGGPSTLQLRVAGYHHHLESRPAEVASKSGRQFAWKDMLGSELAWK